MKSVVKANIPRMLFIVFLILAFFIGAYVYVFVDMKKMISKMGGRATDEKSTKEVIPEKIPDPTKSNDKICPDILIKRGNKLHLSKSKSPNEPPKIFDSLEAYREYVKTQKQKGIVCPTLYVQEEFNTQGQTEMRVRPNPFDPQYGLPITSTIMKPIDLTPIKYVDSSRDNPQFNQNMYPGFDPKNLYIGRKTELDVIHESTEKEPVSENAMDTNWGGVIYTQQAINSGKYDGNKVESTNYVAMAPTGGQTLPIPNKYVVPPKIPYQ